MRSRFLFLAALVALAAATAGPTTAQSRRLVLTAALRNEIINPVTARFLIRAVDRAEAREAACMVILLDTPGGLVDSTRDIVRRILDSRVPVVVYVWPRGGRAASAGLFITIAGHIAAMAPGTTIGAAHPVQVGGFPIAPPEPTPRGGGEPRAGNDSPARPTSPMEDKALRDTEAWARSLAELRGRNVEWIASAVTESAAMTASEAVANDVVDLVVPDVTALLVAIEGRQVTTARGPIPLRIADAEVEALELWWGERLLSTLANPNLAFMLLIIGFYGLLFELYTAGWGVGGTIGVICLVLGFFSMAILPINYGGLALLVIGLALFVAEAFVTSHALLAFGGAACVGIGGLMLVDSPPGFMRVSPWLVLPVTLATAGLTAFLVSRVIHAHRQEPLTGAERMLKERGVAAEPFVEEGGHFSGAVHIHGELWQATSEIAIAEGSTVRVVAREGLTLRVEPAGEPGSAAPRTAGAAGAGR